MGTYDDSGKPSFVVKTRFECRMEFDAMPTLEGTWVDDVAVGTKFKTRDVRDKTLPATGPVFAVSSRSSEVTGRFRRRSGICGDSWASIRQYPDARSGPENDLRRMSREGFCRIVVVRMNHGICCKSFFEYCLCERNSVWVEKSKSWTVTTKLVFSRAVFGRKSRRRLSPVGRDSAQVTRHQPG